MEERPFRFGVSVWTAASRAEWIGKARKVEDLGFSTLVTADHLAPLLPPFLPLVAAAEATSRLRVGTLVLNNDFRHPVQTAREAATVDLLTEGRFELGIGAGHMKSEYDEAGLPFDPGPSRIERLAESVTIIKRLFTGDAVRFAGQYYTIDGHTSYPAPVQRPALPLLIGGNHRRVLELAAREATIAGLTGFGQTAEGQIRLSAFSAEGAERRIDWMRAAAGERFAGLELNALVQSVTVTDDRAAAAEAMTARLPGLTAAQILASPFLLIGNHDQMEEALIERRRRLGISYYVVFEAAMDGIAPVVARLTGR